MNTNNWMSDCLLSGSPQPLVRVCIKQGRNGHYVEGAVCDTLEEIDAAYKDMFNRFGPGIRNGVFKLVIEQS